MNSNEDTAQALPSVREAFAVWLRIGLLSFGGPAAQIALMHREIVEQKGWLTEKQYLNALSFCMLLPGPEAMQLATYAGWRLHGTMGGLLAGLMFVLPGAIVVFILSMIYGFYGDVSLVSALFLGVKAAVVVIVIEALLRVSKRALQKSEHWLIAGIAFIGIFFFALPYPMIIVAAALFGYVRAGKNSVDELPLVARSFSIKDSTQVALIWLTIWLTPLLLLWFIGDASLLLEIGTFFSKLAVVTFGGAYAVLAYLGQDVVTLKGWLTAGEMMDGLGLAETTPGPLILVNEFVGFIAGFREGGLWYALLATLITLWMTFAPCFLWIFVGAPYIDWISAQSRLRGALQAITAAVVGVILNLSIWFALHVFFADVRLENYAVLQIWLPNFATLNWIVVVLTSLSAVLLLMRHWSVSRVLALSSVLGWGLTTLF